MLNTEVGCAVTIGLGKQYNINRFWHTRMLLHVGLSHPADNHTRFTWCMVQPVTSAKVVTSHNNFLWIFKLQSTIDQLRPMHQLLMLVFKQV